MKIISKDVCNEDGVAFFVTRQKIRVFRTGKGSPYLLTYVLTSFMEQRYS
jgi:hypothetical protein